MESSLQLLVFCGVMFLGSYLAGSLPLAMSLNEEKLHLVSVLGAGLLLGTALAVIIPEGMQTMIMAYSRRAMAVQQQQEDRDLSAAPSSPGDRGHDHDHGQGQGHGHGHHHDPLEGLDKAIGVSLVLGFLFMLLVDQIASAKNSAKAGGEHGLLESGAGPVSPSSPSPRNRHSSTGTSSSSPVNWTTTLGLVVHAAADGIALGAAATTRQTDVEVIVFLAIMLHKAPAAFGLTTFLLHEGLERHRIKKHLMTFALSAPATALFTYVTLNARAQSQSMDTLSATGVAMLFSAGTFLYVATVHVLPEVTSGGGGKGSAGAGGSHSHGISFTKCELVMLVIGSLIPLILTLGHHH